MGRIKKVEQMTETKFLNLYTFEGENGKNVPFKYFVASRARKSEDLKINTTINKSDGVAIYCLYGEKKDKIVLVKQYRVPVNDYIYELPAGLCEDGEDFHNAAIREMYEETGLKFEPLKVDPMFEHPRFTSIGMSDESVATVYGYGYGIPTSIHEEASEEIEVVIADKEEVKRILKEENLAIMCAYQLMHFLNDDEPFEFLKK